jgi:hypothetical protein
MNRRGFLARAGAATTGLVSSLALPWAAGAASPVAGPKIRIVYALHGPQQTGPDWPNKGFDFEPSMKRIEAHLAGKCRGFDFVRSLAKGEEDAKAILEQDKTSNIDGYLVCQMNCWNRVVQTLATSGKPVLYADFQYGGSGGFLVYNAAFLRSQSANVGYVASSNLDDLAEGVKCFAQIKTGKARDFASATAKARVRVTPAAQKLQAKSDTVPCLEPDECLKKLKQTRLLAIRGQESGPAGEVAGIQVQHVPFAELNEAWKAADQDQAKAIADQWKNDARKVEGVSPETLKASAAMYLAEKALLQKYNAKGITINCLGGFYGGHIQAYPCLGFFQLNNEGLVGGCECDVRSASTMLIGTVLTQGRPGYISDPVIDTSKRQIIYAHCVSSSKAFGPQGQSNPFEILTHSEDRQGASVRSLLPTGFMTTTLEFEPARKEILFHRAMAVGNDPDDRACRTKLCAQPVGDIEKLFSMWDQWGWHRVTFYGDLQEPVQALAQALGWKVVEEA